MINEATAALQMRWVPVTSPNGRTHMECVWLAPAQLRDRSATTANIARKNTREARKMPPRRP